MEKITIREASFYVNDSFVDEARSCVFVPKKGDNIDWDKINLIDEGLRRKYPSFDFSQKIGESEEDNLVFHYKNKG